MTEGVDKSRLDVALVERGLARSRTTAARLVDAGLVRVDGESVARSSLRVAASAVIDVEGADHYVSRAAHKLIAALDDFGIDVTARVALDVGASTGGFSQVLLERGARTVLAIDVGHGQLDPSLNGEERLLVREGVNARELTTERMVELFGRTDPIDLVVVDLSFISLSHVMPALRAVAADTADFVLLVKPQFEVGRSGVREGIVRDAALREDAITNVAWSAWDLGLGVAGVRRSPIAGTHGNREYLLWLSAQTGRNPAEWSDDITTAVGV